jgi:hypothetical protein
MANTKIQTVLFFRNSITPDTLCGDDISGTDTPENKRTETIGRIINMKTRKCQFALPNISKNSVVIIVTGTTPHAYTEWSLLISRSGSSEGIEAIIGLIKTSASPADAEKTIVPITRPISAVCDDKRGHSEYIRRPKNVMYGIDLTTLGILKRCEKNEKTTSIASCVRKFIRTRNPKNENDRLYSVLKIRKRSGGIFPTIDMERLIV